MIWPPGSLRSSGGESQEESKRRMLVAHAHEVTEQWTRDTAWAWMWSGPQRSPWILFNIIIVKWQKFVINHFERESAEHVSHYSSPGYKPSLETHTLHYECQRLCMAKKTNIPPVAYWTAHRAVCSYGLLNGLLTLGFLNCWVCFLCGGVERAGILAVISWSCCSAYISKFIICDFSWTEKLGKHIYKDSV